MDEKLNILVQAFFEDTDDKYKLNDFLNKNNSENVKNQLAKDLSNFNKISNNDLYNIFKSKLDLYFNLFTKDLLFEDIINFFTNEEYFNKDKSVFKPFDYLIKGKVLRHKDLYNILMSYDTDTDCYKFIDNILIRVLSKMISELEHLHGFHQLESLNLGIENYNKYVSRIPEKLKIYNKIKVFLNREDKSQFIKLYLSQIIDEINAKIKETSEKDNIELEKIDKELSKKKINIKKVIELAKKYKIKIDPIQIENYKIILNNVEKVRNVYVKFNMMMIQNIVQNAKHNKEYEKILSNNDSIFIVDNILINIFKKYKNVFLEEKFKNIIFFKYTIESLIAIELNTDIVNVKIINILKEKYPDAHIDDALLSEIINNSNLNDLYVLPIETNLAIKCKIDLIEFEKIVSSEIHHDLKLDNYIFDIDILKKIWPNMLKVDLILKAKELLLKMNLSKELFLEIFQYHTYNENNLEKVTFPLKLYKNPLEALIAFTQNVDITNIERIWFKINIPKDTSKLHDIIIKHTNSITINKSNFDLITKRIREEFLKTDKYRNHLIINDFKIKKELLEYINSFAKISENEAIALLNNILSKNIFEYDVFQKIIVYKYSLEALLCIMLDVPINDELFEKVNILPSIHILEKTKKKYSFLSMLNSHLIKEINLFLSTFNKYSTTKFLKKLELKTVYITNDIRLNIKNEISKIILKTSEPTYKPTEQEVVMEILKTKFELTNIINDEILKVKSSETNLEPHIEHIKLRYRQLETDVNLIEKRIANVKSKKDYSAMIEEKIFNSSNYKLNATIIVFMCTNKNLIWFRAQRPEIKYKILCDIIENGLDKKYIPEYLSDYSTFENYLYNVFYKFVCNTLITVSIQKYNFNYKLPKVEFLKAKNLTDTTIEIINNKPFIKRNGGNIIEMKKIGDNTIVLDNNNNILKYNDKIIFYDVDYLFAAEEDFVFSSNGKYYYDSLMYPMPDNMIINESSTKHVQYYIDEISYFAKDIVPVYEYLYLKINHDVSKLNKNIIQQYKYESDDFESSNDKRNAYKKYSQENVLEFLKNDDFSKINYLYTYDHLNDDTLEFLRSNIILNNDEYVKSLKEIFKDLISHEESNFKKEMHYGDRMSNVLHLEKNYFFNIKDFCKDLEYILYTFYNADYFEIIKRFSDFIFENPNQTITKNVPPLFTLEEIESFQNYQNLQDYGVYSISIEYKVGISSPKFQTLKNEYLELCKLFSETLGYEENFNINIIFNNISSFLRYMDLPQFITLKDNKIYIETNELEFEDDLIKTVKVMGKRMDKFVDYIIKSIESKITILSSFFDVFYNSFEKYIKLKHRLILIDINPKVNVDIVHKLFGLSLFAPIKFIVNEIDNVDLYKNTLEYLYQNLNVYSIKIKSLNSNILDLLNDTVSKINCYKEINKTIVKRKFCEKKTKDIIKKYYYFDLSEIIDNYYKLEFKFTTNIKVLSNIISKNQIGNAVLNETEERTYSEEEFIKLLDNINNDIYNLSNYTIDKKFTSIQLKTINHLLNTIISKLNQQQIFDAEKSRLCRFILLYNDIPNFKEIKYKNYSNIRNKFLNRLVKKYLFLKKNVYSKDRKMIIERELDILRKKEDKIYSEENTHYETKMNNLIANFSLNKL